MYKYYLKLFFRIRDSKMELVKLILFIVYLFLNKVIYGFISPMIINRYGILNFEYILKLISFVLMIGISISCFRKINKFCLKEVESLELLGVNKIVIILLLFSKMSGIYYIGISIFYFIANYFKIDKVKIFINTGFMICIIVLIILLVLKFYFKVLNFLLGGGLIFFILIVIYSVNFTYYNIYDMVMSRKFNLFYKKIFLELNFALVFAACFLLIYILNTKNKILKPKFEFKHSKLNNGLYDLLHNKALFKSNKKDYFIMYRNNEFKTWKLVTTIFILIGLYLSDNILLKFIILLFVAIINIFYLLDLYNMELDNQTLYKMCGYSFDNYIKDKVISGTCLVGDHIFLSILLCSVIDLNNLLLSIPILITIVLTVLFFTIAIYSFFPKPQKQILSLYIIVIMMLPIINVIWIISRFKILKRIWKREIGEGEVNKCWKLKI